MGPGKELFHGIHRGPYGGSEYAQFLKTLNVKFFRKNQKQIFIIMGFKGKVIFSGFF